MKIINRDVFCFNLLMEAQDDTITLQSLTELEQLVHMKKKEILHNHKKSIIQLGSGRYEGYFQTYVKDTITGKRKVLRAKSRELLEEKILDFYTHKTRCTVRECYEGWINYIQLDKKPSTVYAYEKVQKRHFKDLDNAYIEELSPYDIKLFVKKAVKDKKLTAKGYAALKTNLLGIFHYAKDKYGYDCNIDAIVSELSRELRGSFAPTKKSSKKDEELIFSDDEVESITSFCKESGTLVDLGICLLFETGLRIGELSTLKDKDIDDDYRCLTIRRTEERIGSGADYIVSESTKTEAGTREVLLTHEAAMLLKRIKFQSNYNSDYLFSDNDFERYLAKKFRDRLYRICIKLGIPRRGPHAIRRTYASRLARAGVSELVIIRQMGHTDFSVTKSFYICNNRSREDIIQELEHAK